MKSVPKITFVYKPRCTSSVSIWIQHQCKHVYLRILAPLHPGLPDPGEFLYKHLKILPLYYIWLLLLLCVRVWQIAAYDFLRAKIMTLFHYIYKTEYYWDKQITELLDNNFKNHFKQVYCLNLFREKNYVNYSKVWKCLYFLRVLIYKIT